MLNNKFVLVSILLIIAVFGLTAFQFRQGGTFSQINLPHDITFKFYEISKKFPGSEDTNQQHDLKTNPVSANIEKPIKSIDNQQEAMQETDQTNTQPPAANTNQETVCSTYLKVHGQGEFDSDSCQSVYWYGKEKRWAFENCTVPIEVKPQADFNECKKFMINCELIKSRYNFSNCSFNKSVGS